VLLSQEEGRVIGSLIEKELTTPQQYPLTLNALVLACNQSSNRDPVVAFDDRTVDNAVAKLKADGLVRFVYPSHGRSVTRYQQLLGEQLGISQSQLGLVALLLLRGPQTGAELRARSERMCEFDGIDQVEAELDQLSRRDEAVVARLPRRPGQKEERWAQLLTDSPGDLAGPSQRDVPAGRPMTDLAAEVAELQVEVAELRDQLARLREQLDTLQQDLGPLIG
jgi:uncharacterized protein